MRGSTVALVLASHLVGGCSIVFTREPRYAPVRPEERASCTESRIAPAADAVLAGALFAASGALVWYGATMSPARNEHECASCLAFGAAMVPAAYGTIAGLSSIAGFHRTRRCERVHDAQRRCLDGDPAACSALQADGEPEDVPRR